MNLNTLHFCVTKSQSWRNNMFSLFKDKGFWVTAFKLTLPVVIQNLLTSSYTLVDTLLVSNLGTVALSSVGMVGQWAWLMNMILIGFASATTVFVSQFWGVKDLKKIRHVEGISTVFALGISTLFTAVSLIVPQLVVKLFNSDAEIIRVGSEYLRYVALSYIPIALTNILAAVLRAVENVKLPMYVSGLSTVVNIVLDYAMIFGKFGFPKMGVKGAAVATVISAWMGLALVVIVSLAKKNILIDKPKNIFNFSKQEIVSYIKIATPVVLNEGMWGAGNFVYNIIYGNMGYEYFSALTILRSFENISFVLFIGISSAAAVMIGKSIGKGNIERGLVDSKRFMIIVPVLAVIVAVFIFIFRHQLVSVFNMGDNISKVAIDTAVIVMSIYACAFPFRMLPYLEVVAVFRAGGDTVTGAKQELFCLWALSVPATIISVYVFKVPFVAAFAIMYIFEDIPKNIMTLKFYLSKKWIKPVTKEGIEALDKLKSEDSINE